MSEAIAILALALGALLLVLLHSREDDVRPPPPIDIQEAWRRRQKRRSGR